MRDRSKQFSMDVWRDPTRSLSRLRSVDSQLTALFNTYKKRVIDLFDSEVPGQQFKHTQKAGDVWPTGFVLAKFIQQLEELSTHELIGPANAILSKEIPDAYTHGTKFADIHLKPIGIVLGSPLAERQAKSKIIGALVTKSQGEFKGVTDATNQVIRRVVSDGIINEASFGEISRGIVQAVDGVGIVRASMIARTETMKAINTAAKDRYQQGGIERGEWCACEDERTCNTDLGFPGGENGCGGLDGHVFDLDEFPDCPAHVNCRCAILPYVDIPVMSKKDDLQPLKDLDRPRDLQHVEDVMPDARMCPFPYLDDRPSPGQIIEGKVTIERIPFKNLYAGQIAVSKKQVKHIMKKIEDGEYDGKTPDKVIVVHHKDKHFIWSGHHHCAALLLSGYDSVEAVHHIELGRAKVPKPIKQKIEDVFEQVFGPGKVL